MFRGSLIFLIFSTFLFAKEIFLFDVVANKKNLKVGEELKLTYTFKYKTKREIAQLNFTPPSFDKLYIKKRQNLPKINKNGFVIIKKIFLLSSKIAQKIKIDPATIDIAILKNQKKELGEFEDFDYDFKTFQTKPITIDFQNLPKNSSLYGDFNITSFVDKKIFSSNEPINLTIKITGSGSFENIKEFDFNLPNATIYKNPPILDKNGFVQKFSILASSDFTIPSFSITYFDAKEKKTVTKKTAPIDIKIKKSSLKFKKKTFYQTTTENRTFLIISFFIGVIFGYGIAKVLKKREKNLDDPLLKRVKDAKDTKEILQILLATKQTKDIEQIIDELHKDIYIKKKKSLSKKNIYSRLINLYNNNQNDL